MYAVVNHLHFTKPVADFADAVRDEGMPLLAGLGGFRDFKFVQVDDNHAIVLIFWSDAESARAGAAKFGPSWFAANFAPYLASEQQRSTGRVLVSYGA